MQQLSQEYYALSSTVTKHCNLQTWTKGYRQRLPGVIVQGYTMSTVYRPNIVNEYKTSTGLVPRTPWPCPRPLGCTPGPLAVPQASWPDPAPWPGPLAVPRTPQYPSQVCLAGEELVSAQHYDSDNISHRITELKEHYDKLKTCCEQRDVRLNEVVVYQTVSFLVFTF